MLAQDAIVQLGKVLKLPDLVLDQNNVCQVILDENPVDFEKLPDGEELFISAEVCPVSLWNDARLFRRLLEGNLYGIETRGSVLSIDSARNVVLLHQRVDVSKMEHTEFMGIMDTFYASLLHWKKVYEEYEEDAQHTTPEEEQEANIITMLRI